MHYSPLAQIKEAIIPKANNNINDNGFHQTEVCLHICKMSMANIITSLTTPSIYPYDNMAHSTNKLIKRERNREKKPQSTMQNSFTAKENLNKPSYSSSFSSLSIERNHYSIRPYFTPVKEGTNSRREEKFLLIKESSDPSKSPLIMGLILKKKADEYEESLYQTNNMDNINDSYTKILMRRIQFALEQDRCFNKAKPFFDKETSFEDNVLVSEKYNYCLYPFITPLELNELMKKKTKKMIFRIQKDDKKDSLNEKKSYKDSELSIQHCGLFIPAYLRRSRYEKILIEAEEQSRNSSDSEDDFDRLIEYLQRKRKREREKHNDVYYNDNTY